MHLCASPLNYSNIPRKSAMNILENRIPPPKVMLIFGAIMWMVSPGVPKFEEVGTVRMLAMIGSILAASFFSAAGVLAFRKAKTTVNPLKPDSASAMVSTGVYRMSRNPMYVGFLLLLVAWGFYLFNVWAFLGVVGFVAYINRFQIVPEERAMLKLFGSEFERYSNSVRRWI